MLVVVSGHCRIEKARSLSHDHRKRIAVGVSNSQLGRRQALSVRLAARSNMMPNLLYRLARCSDAGQGGSRFSGGPRRHREDRRHRRRIRVCGKFSWQLSGWLVVSHRLPPARSSGGSLRSTPATLSTELPGKLATEEFAEWWKIGCGHAILGWTCSAWHESGLTAERKSRFARRSPMGPHGTPPNKRRIA